MSSLLLPSAMREHHGTETSTFPVKGVVNMAAVERDAGFCSGGDDEEVEDDLQSPTDVSEDSVEVKVLPISLRNKNKRKCAEPRKVSNEEAGPYKKRRGHFETKKVLEDDCSAEVASRGSATSPFRPWSHHAPPQDHPRLCPVPSPSTSPKCSSTCVGTSSPNAPQYNDRVPALHQQEEPLSLVLKNSGDVVPQRRDRRVSDSPRLRLVSEEKRPKRIDLPSSSSVGDLTVSAPISRSAHRTLPSDDRLLVEDLSGHKSQPRTKFSVESLLSAGGSRGPEVDSRPGPSSSASTSSEGKKMSSSPGGQQRNYKNMTRERRIEANARERTRVHTISAAFDTLRRAIPAYSHNQKLSKLSVLRIACSYILTLSRVAGADYSIDQSEPSLAECVDLVSRTIQTEGKLRKKKDD
ncbi:transcription factor ATOH8 [Anabrus simplex]|uniref:transcription factor ATOH8 n=1 Tax=Anabrus simplex TaxID=316456 RepID=UPI0034DD2026